MCAKKLKLVKALGIISAGIMALAVLVFLFCVVLQRPLVRLYLNEVYLYNTKLFMFPVDVFFSLFSALLVSVALIFVAGNKRIGIWADILIVAFSSVVKPVGTYLISLLRNVFVTRFVYTLGSDAVAYNSGLSSAISMFTSFASVGLALLYIVCGMSIILKLSEKEEKNVCELG